MAISLEIVDHIAVMTFNRPEVMNAIDPETQDEFIAICKEVKENPEIWVLVLTGAGEKAFCTGADMKKTLPPKESFGSLFVNSNAYMFIQELNMNKPIICAINGYALGGGLELALACDIRIAAEHASFGLPEVKSATMPGAGGTQRLARMIPYAYAMKMLLTGDRIDADEAQRLGLITDVVPIEELMPTAMAMAEKICNNGPLAVRAVKMACQNGYNMTLEQGIQYEQLLWGSLRDSEDRIEGRKAFAEKRKPEFKGR